MGGNRLMVVMKLITRFKEDDAAAAAAAAATVTFKSKNQLMTQTLSARLTH